MDRNEFLKRISELDGDQKYDAILDYSRFLRQIDPQESITQAKIVLKYANQIENDKLILNAITYISTSYIYSSDFSHAEKWLEVLKEKGEELGLDKAMGDYYNMKARIMYQQNNAASALELMLKAVGHYLKTESATDKISCYNALGIIYLEMDNNEKARHYLELALDISIEHDNPAQHSIRLNLSNILYRMKKYEEVIKVNLDSLSFFQENKMRVQEATALGNIGLCYYELGKTQESLDYFMNVRDIYIEMKNALKIVSNSLSIARAYMKQDDLISAKEFLDESKEIAEKNEFKLDLAIVYKAFADYYEQKGEYRNANEYLRKMHDHYANVNEENQKQELSELEARYNNEIIKLRNKELKENNQAMNKQIEDLNQAIAKLQNTYHELEKKFQHSADQIIEQEDLISSQARTAVMGEMISAIAHQWKQPLNIIWILTQAIQDAWDYEEITEEFIINQTQQIGEQINYMSETINDFRNFFKEKFVKDYSIAEVIEKAYKLVSYMIKQSGIEVVKELDENCTLSGNPNELMQVLINIINNARQAIEESSPPERKINIKLVCEKKNLTITVYNKGDNITEENMKKIFQPYFTTKGETGTGIGLNISQHIIKNKYNGEITAKNTTDGVIFAISILKNN